VAWLAGGRSDNFADPHGRSFTTGALSISVYSKEEA